MTRAIRSDPYLPFHFLLWLTSLLHIPTIYWWDTCSFPNPSRSLSHFFQQFLSFPFPPNQFFSLGCSSMIISSSLDPLIWRFITPWIDIYHCTVHSILFWRCLFTYSEFFSTRRPCNLHFRTSLQSSLQYLAANRHLINICWINEFSFFLKFASNYNSYNLLSSFYMQVL